jgi:hypothetical protein
MRDSAKQYAVIQKALTSQAGGSFSCEILSENCMNS